MPFNPPSITNILGSDLISDSRAVINNNFTALSQEATQSLGGLVQLATTSGVLNNTETSTAVTPDKLHSLFAASPTLIPAIATNNIGSSSDPWNNIYLSNLIDFNGDELVVSGGTIYVNGTEINDLIVHPSVSGFVTLDTAQTISATKTFFNSDLELSGNTRILMYSDIPALRELEISPSSGNILFQSLGNFQFGGLSLIVGEGNNTNPITTRTIERYRQKVNFKPPADLARSSFIDWDIAGAKTIYLSQHESGQSIPILAETTTINLPAIYNPATNNKRHGMKYTIYKVNDTNTLTLNVSGSDLFGHSTSGTLSSIFTNTEFSSITIESMSITSGENYWVIHNEEGTWSP